jgi:hypothetical protein
MPRLLDADPRCLLPVREVPDSLSADCRPHALALGCARGLDALPRLAATNGGAGQPELVALTPASMSLWFCRVEGSGQYHLRCPSDSDAGGQALRPARLG